LAFSTPKVRNYFGIASFFHCGLAME